MGPQEKKFTEWFEQEKKKGLVDLKVSVDETLTSVDREEFFGELNDMNEAIAQGKGVPIDWEKLELEG